jgi:glycosyltransferase involved in cell wall biosynthesis
VTPRVLLLQEDLATGGITTIAKTLHNTLERHGWSVTALVLDQSRWHRLIAAARRSDVILAGHNFRPAYVAWALGLALRKPVVVWVHGPLQEVLAQANASSLKRGWLRWLYHRIPYFVFVSRTSRESFERCMEAPWAPHRQGVIIPNVVTLEAPATAVPAQGDATETVLQLGYIGRLSPEKQPALLLEMLRLLPLRFRLTLVGDGPLREELQRLGTDLLAGGRLTLAGSASHGSHLYTPWHLTVLASRYEGCPMMPLESFASGVPCVALPVPALEELLGEDAPDFLARGHSAQHLADAVQAVSALPRRQLQEDMARVLSRHQEQEFVRRWQAVLRDAAGPC